MNELLTVAEVADVLAVSTKTVRNLITAGALPSVVFGRRSNGQATTLRVERSALDEFIASRREGRSTDGAE